MDTMPDGFEPHFRSSGLTDPWEPIFSKRVASGIVLGLRAGPAHVNGRGFVHGGLISALADNAMGLSCALAIGNSTSVVTVSLAVDFMSPAQVGQWLEFTTTFMKLGSTICFAQGFVTADGAVCAKSNGTFKVVGQSSRGTPPA